MYLDNIHAEKIWSLDDDDRRYALASRASRGAAQALRMIELERRGAKQAQLRAQAEAERIALDEQWAAEVRERVRIQEAEEQGRIIEAKKRANDMDIYYEPQSGMARDIIKEICDFRGVTPEAVKSKSRRRRVCLVRNEVAYWIRSKKKMSMPQIAEILGGRDHTTIYHSLRRYAAKHGLPEVVGAGK